MYYSAALQAPPFCGPSKKFPARLGKKCTNGLLPAGTSLVSLAMGTLLVDVREECADSAESVPQEKASAVYTRTLSMNIFMSTGGSCFHDLVHQDNGSVSFPDRPGNEANQNSAYMYIA
jgi:hypothetical protein